MSQISTATAKKISKKSPAELIACCVIVGALAAWGGFVFCRDVADYHWFWSACVAVLGSAGLLRGVYGAAATLLQSNMFLRYVRQRKDPKETARSYVGRLGLRPDSEISDISVNVTMLTLVPLIVIGVYDFPWRPESTGFIVARVAIIVLLSAVAAFLLGLLFQWPADRCSKRVKEEVQALQPEAFQAFRDELRSIRRNQGSVLQFLWRPPVDETIEKSPAQADVWRAVVCLACAEKQKLVRKVERYYFGMWHHEPEPTWPALCDEAVKRIRKAQSHGNGGSGVPHRLADEILRRARATRAISLEQAKSLPGYREYVQQVTGGSLAMPARIPDIREWAVVFSSVTLSALDKFVSELPDHSWLTEGIDEELDEWDSLEAA